MQKPLIVWHRSDLDGVCSAAIVKHFVPDAELFGIDHGEEFPWPLLVPSASAQYDTQRHVFEQAKVSSFGSQEWHDVPGEFSSTDAILQTVLAQYPEWVRRTVYLVDFSLPVEEMKRLAQVSNLIWIDHHKTAIDAVEKSGLQLAGAYRTGVAACELCWEWFSVLAQCDTGGGYPLPEAVRLLGAYDSWRQSEPDWYERILPYQYGLRSEPGIYDPECAEWKRGVIERDEFDDNEYISYGQRILHFQAEQCRRIAENGAFEFILASVPPTDPASAGHLPPWRCLCLNTPIFSSQSFASAYDPEKHDIMVAFARMKDGRWKVSLYSTKPAIDCGLIAKAFGGGGHKGAAGFLCDQLPWEA